MRRGVVRRGCAFWPPSSLSPRSACSVISRARAAQAHSTRWGVILHVEHDRLDFHFEADRVDEQGQEQLDDDGSHDNNADDIHHATTTTVVGGPAGQIKVAKGRTSIPVTSLSLPARLLIDGVGSRPAPRVPRPADLDPRARVRLARLRRTRSARLRAVDAARDLDAAGVSDEPGRLRHAHGNPEGDVPLKRGCHVPSFLRTRKEGDSLLAGVSGRRLAQVATG